MSRKLIPLAILAMLAIAAVAHAQSGGGQLTSSWAQLNSCSPTLVGARAQLAGDGTTKQMYVRFTAQWLDGGAWVPVAGAATSPWLEAGSAEYTWQQAGWNFGFDAPAAGQSYQVRALAELQWRDGGSVARSETRVTGGCTLAG